MPPIDPPPVAIPAIATPPIDTPPSDAPPIDAPPIDAPLASTGLPPDLRFLKTLVTLLTFTMIIGLITIVAVIVTRFPTGSPATPVLPAGLALPAGTEAGAVTIGAGWVLVVTKAGDAALIFDAKTGALRQRIAITPN